MGSSSAQGDGSTDEHALTGFDLQVLGSASKMPTLHSSCPCIGLRLGPTQLLFDVGEGTQRQFMRSFLNPFRVQGIFITHMHGDHILGLPGMLLSFLSYLHNTLDAAAAAAAAVSAEQQPGLPAAAAAPTTQTLRVFGPEGLYNYVAMTLRLCEARIGANPVDGRAPIEVHELVGAGERRAAFVKRDPDFASPGIEWRPIERDPDGFWTIPPLTHPHPHSAADSSSSVLEEQWGFTVRAGAIRHSVPTFGYTVAEKPKRGKLDARKVRGMGLPPGPLYKQLARGEDVALPNGRGVVRAAEVLGPPQRGRKLTVLGDTCDASGMAPLALDSDVLVHEATLEDARAHTAVLRGHSTPAMAAAFARDVRARRLLLTHFSNRYSSYLPLPLSSPGDDGQQQRQRQEEGEAAASSPPGTRRPGVDRLVQQAVAVLGDERRVLAAHDFLQVHVPAHGFDLVGALPRRGAEQLQSQPPSQQQHHHQHQQQQQSQQPPQPPQLQWREGAGGAAGSSDAVAAS